MNGMPIGPPSQRPAPKSAWKPVLAPIVVTIELEFESTGIVSIGVFQVLLAGSTEQPPITCCASAARGNNTASAKASTTPGMAARGIDHSVESPWVHGRHG